ncbi:MAG: hypothetical protein COC09_06095 [Gammaproteobacteria bacterium]|nr:MAG: hypothetical protein COC09_06095 [Gammaproteobacteria bacterium]
MVSPFHTYIESFNGSNQPTRQGAQRRALWAALWLSCGQPDHGENHALPENAKNRSNDSI